MQSNNKVFEVLDEYLTTMCEYAPSVVGRADTGTYPKVVVTFEQGNPAWQSNGVFEYVCNNTVTIDIYANDEPLVSSLEIAENIRNHVFECMSRKLGYRLTFSKPTPNIDESIYRLTMKYSYNSI